MKIGVVGCGYVFDLYMATLPRHPELQIVGVTDRDRARAETVGRAYGLRVHDSTEALLADPEVETVANFTSIEAHYAVSRAALEAGKHVYSEKPLTTTLEEARDLVGRAEARGLRLSAAPSNLLSPAVQTLWKIVADGALGPVPLVYAEFDDNPVPLLAPETWRSATGAPWPALHEYAMGCTWEHAGYHLAWMCALFGPVTRLTAVSSRILPDKAPPPHATPETPDFSVAVLDFESGTVGRLTCSIAAPADHRMRVIGTSGMAEIDTYRDDAAPVRLWPFTPLSLKAANARAVRRQPWLAGVFGTGGRRVPHAPGVAEGRGAPRPGLRPGAWAAHLRRRQRGQQDKCAGLAEMAAALREGRPHMPPPDFTLHVTELTLAIQAAGPDGAHHVPETRFAPLAIPPAIAARAPDYRRFARPAPLPRLIARLTGK